ncbi:hypothetical protein CgunFtcFv8_015918 [Champsocephalus gunnari]|uniref:BHLH domain-containing protein n=1 Tax=Champsocephalus gunnari TaxID=52237 RepID=A0AAN8H1K0_CHAGU|nr:hypothetical protein CgunFtcFv8_015918 [Champsocephalus gunnari]
MSIGSAASDAEDYVTRRRKICRFPDEEDERRMKSKVSKGQKDERPETQRNAANARERSRMRVLSKAFSRLKTSLPWVPADTKLSKLDTLRLASSYISHLRQILQEDRLQSCGHPVNLTWPFLIGRSDDGPDVPPSVRLCGATA